MSRTRRVFAGVTIFLLAMLGASAPAFAASATLSGDAEAGTLAGFGDTLNASATTSAAHTGTYGYRINSTAAGGYLNWTATDVEQAHTWASVSALVRVNSHAGAESTDLVTIKNNNLVNHFDLFLTPDNYLKWDLLISDNDQTAVPITLGSWHLVEARVFFGGTTYTAQVRVDGVDQGTISSTGQTTTTARSFWFGTSNAKTHSFDVDDAEAEVADMDPGYLGTSYTAPTVATNCSQLTLRATINPGGESTEVVFQYGTTTSMVNTTAVQSAGSGSSGVVVSALITPAGTTTYYRAVANNLGGTTNGVMKTETCS